MKSLAIAFAGGSAVLLACAVHDDTSFPNSPQPTDTISPGRTVVFDSGVVTLLGEAGVGPSGTGPAGQFKPDAAPEPDLAPEITLPDAGGVGANCSVFEQNCTAPLACSPNLAQGTQTCQPVGSNQILTLYSSCNPAPGANDAACVPGLVCVTVNGNSSCTNLCPMNSTADCVGSYSNTCKKLGAFTDVGYCG